MLKEVHHKVKGLLMYWSYTKALTQTHRRHKLAPKYTHKVILKVQTDIGQRKLYKQSFFSSDFLCPFSSTESQSQNLAKSECVQSTPHKVHTQMSSTESSEVLRLQGLLFVFSMFAKTNSFVNTNIHTHIPKHDWTNHTKTCL